MSSDINYERWPDTLPPRCWKTAYATKQEALQARKIQDRRNRKAGIKTAVNVYKCPSCQGWHLGRDNRQGISRSLRRL